MATNEFWNCINAIAQSLPFRKDKMERLLDARLERESANAYFVMYSWCAGGRARMP